MCPLPTPMCILAKMHFPRKPQEKKLRELSLPSPPLDSQFPQHPMSPGQDVAETSERMLELANENMHMKAIYVSWISNYIYIYIYMVIYLLGGLRLWCQFNCVKGNNFCFWFASRRTSIVLRAKWSKSRLKPATLDGYLAFAGWFVGSPLQSSWPSTPTEQKALLRFFKCHNATF